ncbi:MAG: cyclic nucleotide-binding domain-containing protein [Polyangiaceae bacterium]|nr:cyclic nucleotide-binding domain-containing protein [Polyangiaceae bacterium]
MHNERELDARQGALLDRALALGLEGDPLGALGWAGSALVHDAEAAAALLVMGQAFGKLEEPELAVEALRTSAAAAADAGQLPVAVAACLELRAQGIDPSFELDELAATYARGSSRLMEHGASPPRLPHGTAPAGPWLDGSDRKATIDRARKAMAQARTALDSERARGLPLVARQGFFSTLEGPSLRALLEVLEVEATQADATVIEQGTAGAEAFIVARGEVEVWRRPPVPDAEATVLARLGAGALFGEMALLSRAPRAAMVTARRPTVLLVARKRALDELADEQPDVGRAFAEFCHRRMMVNLLRTSPLLGAVEPSERQLLVRRFKTRAFEAGEAIITQGCEPEGLHLVASGEVVVMHRQEQEATVIAQLGVGEVVGEVSLVLRRPAGADVVATQPTVTLHLPREQFLEVIDQHPVLLKELYSLAVQRDQRTSSIVARPSIEVDDCVLV